MTDETEKPAAFEALFLGDKPNESRGGQEFRFIVPWEEADAARAALDGVWQPDKPINVGIARVTAGGRYVWNKKRAALAEE